MGKFDKALADCNSVIEKSPKYQFVLVSRGDAYLAKGDLDAALKDYNSVLGLNPNNVRAHAGRGQLFEQNSDLAQARADYRSAAFALTPYDKFDTGAGASNRARTAGRADAAGAAGAPTRFAASR